MGAKKVETANRRVRAERLGRGFLFESDISHNFHREWIYLGSQRLAQIQPSVPGSPGGGYHCSLAGGADGGAAFAGAMGLVLLAIGVAKKNRKYQAAGLIFMGGVLFLVLHPEARGNADTEVVYYYHNDHLGTPRMMTEQYQAVMWDVDYSPFGEIFYRTEYISGSQPFRFPGQYSDDVTGFYYNWNRYYMPGVGRYNRVDPLLSEDSMSIMPSIYLNIYGSIPIEYVLADNALLADFPELSMMYNYNYSVNNPILYSDLQSYLTIDKLKKTVNDLKNRFLNHWPKKCGRQYEKNCQYCKQCFTCYAKPTTKGTTITGGEVDCGRVEMCHDKPDCNPQQ